ERKTFDIFLCYFLPTLPSSIQKPPCSFILFLTVLSETPIYSASESIVTSSSIPHASKAVSSAFLRSFFLSSFVFFFVIFFFHGGCSPSGSKSFKLPTLSIS